MRTKKAFLNLLTNIVREIINVLCGFILPYILITSFGSEIYGLTESITNFLGFIVLLEAGFGPVVKVSLYRALAKKDSGLIERILKTTERFFRKIATVFLIYIIGLAVLYPIISNTSFDYIFTATLVIIMAASTFAEYFFGITYRLLLQSDQKTYVTNIIQIFTMLSNLILVIVVVKLGAGIVVVKIITSLIFILKPIIQKIYIKKKYQISLKTSKANYIIEQKWDALIHHIAYMVHSKTDIAILTIMSSLKNVAIYSVYALVLNGIKSIISTIADSFSAAFGDMIAKSEKNILKKSFDVYETMFVTITTIVFSSALTLITPFIIVYTSGIKDADYIQPVFGVLLTTSTYLLTIRQPYNELVKAAGRFKQTRRGAIIEAIVNIVVSIIFVHNFGLIGVAIGTLVAMTIRTTEFVYHANKYILERSIWMSAKKILLVILETVIIVVICNFLPYVENSNYINWGINAIMTAGVAGVVVLGFNTIFFRKELSEALSMAKSLLHRKTSTK